MFLSRTDSALSTATKITASLNKCAKVTQGTKMQIFCYLSLITDVSGSCQSIYGGNWVLIRHAYNQWHNTTDNLAGTDVYGTFDNDPESLSSWSIQFDNILESDGSTLFMFSNGNCSEWMVVE